MKKIVSLICVVSFTLLGSAVFAQSKDKTSSYGAKINASYAIDAATLNEKMANKESMDVKIKGKIKEVCQRKGCWMNIDIGNGKEMKVRFKDYAFFVPKDAAGKTVVMQGTATKQETTVAELKHYAEDAGKSKAEIENIKQSEKSTTFEASGVLIYNE